MAFIGRRLGLRALAAAPIAENFSSTGGLCFRLLRSLSAESAELAGDSTGVLKQRSVGVFWDLDNKPPKNVSPFKAATRLLEMAAGFGNVVDAVAYANHHAFSHVPTWVQEERRKRKMLDELEERGLVKAEELYVCGVCGAKKKTRVELTKHFKSLHEREQKKRMNRLESLRGKKKQKERFWDNNAEKMSKYKEAARSVILPKLGYGLMQDLRRAGLYVRTVEDKPQAADIALQEHMTKCMKKGVRCICLVSDDSDFTPVLKMARERNLHTVVVGDLRVLSAYADTYFSWAEVASGIAEQMARRETRLLMADFMNRLGDKLASHRYKGFGFDDDDVDEADSESDSDGEFEDGKGWRPGDRTVRSDDENQDFDFFSDDSSESDSEAEPDHKFLRPELRQLGYRTDNQRGCGVPGKTRWFSSGRKFEESEDPSFTDIVSETDIRASLPKGSRGAPSKTTAVPESRSSTEEIPVRRLEASASTEKANPSTEAPSSRGAASAGANSESVDKIIQSFFGTSSAFEKQEGLESDTQNPTAVREIEGDAGDSVCSGASSALGTVEGRGSKKEKKLADEEDPDKQTRRETKKLKNHFGGRSGEPVPFYMSGFASESAEDCYRINRWYFDFWKKDEEEYKGRRINVHDKNNKKKKKKKT